MNIDEHVVMAKKMAKLLIPYTFPKVKFEDEQEVIALKQSQMRVDGYDIVVCYSNADYTKYMLESLQIQSVYTPFLPFTVVCKMGRLFLGVENLSYVDFFKNNKKVYCWTVKFKDKSALEPANHSYPKSYEGFDFHVLKPGSVDLY